MTPMPRRGNKPFDTGELTSGVLVGTSVVEIARARAVTDSTKYDLLRSIWVNPIASNGWFSVAIGTNSTSLTATDERWVVIERPIQRGLPFTLPMDLLPLDIDATSPFKVFAKASEANAVILAATIIEGP